MNEYWCVKYKNGQFFTNSLGLSADSSRNSFVFQALGWDFMETVSKAWRRHYKRGCRCVKVRIEEVKQ